MSDQRNKTSWPEDPATQLVARPIVAMAAHKTGQAALQQQAHAAVQTYHELLAGKFFVFSRKVIVLHPRLIAFFVLNPCYS